MWIVFWANILLIIALILLPDISLYYSPFEENPINIEYLILVFTPQKSKKRRKTKHKRVLFSLLSDLTGNSTVFLRDSEQDNVWEGALSSILSVSFMFTKMALIGLIRARAKSTVLVNDLDYGALLKFNFPTYSLFILLLKYPYYILKEKYRRRANER